MEKLCTSTLNTIFDDCRQCGTCCKKYRKIPLQPDEVDFIKQMGGHVGVHVSFEEIREKGMEAATSTYQSLSEAMIKFRDNPPQSGLIANFQQLTGVSGVTPAVLGALEKDFYLSGFTVRNTQIVGPKVGSDLRREAVYVTLAGLAAMLVYIWFRFELIYGVSAVFSRFSAVFFIFFFFNF